MHGLFVTGTDTGAGKTVLTAAIVAALSARRAAPVVLKPVLTGLAERSDPIWPADHEILAAAAGIEPGDVTLLRYGPPVSPHLAAEMASEPIDGPRLVSAIRRRAAAGGRTGPLVVEGVGGLLVPLAEGWDIRRLARELNLPLVIAARPGLGTINHALMTLEVARSAGLTVAGVVLTPWPQAPSRIEISNRSTIERLGDIEVSTLAELPTAARELLAAAGESLPIDRWLRVNG